jgi:hypothetical protein
MKALKSSIGVGLIVVLSSSLLLLAAEANKEDKSKIKPYPLKTCVVSGEKLGEMGKPYVFTNDTREIKLCCKDCLKDFKKDTAKYVKKLEEAEAKDKKKS